MATSSGTGTRAVAAAALAVAVLPVVGCGAADRSGGADARVARRDSAGVEIVISRAPAWSGGEGWRIDAEPSLEIGQVDGPEEAMLYGVVAVRRAGDAILVAQQTELRLYDAGGAFLRRLGGAGQGPGEFFRIASALPCGDRLLATDLSPPRLTVFDPSGAPTTVSLPPPQRPGVLQPLTLRACVPGGVVGSMAGPRPPAVPGAPEVQRTPHLIVRVRETDNGLDTLLSYPGIEVYDGLRVPFGRTTLFAARDTSLYLVDTGEPQVRILGLDGVPRRLLRLALPDRAVTPGDIDRIRRQYTNGLPPSLLAEIEPRFDAVSIPETMQFFSTLRVAPDGTVWLRAYQPFRDEQVTRWTVIDAAGGWLGEVDLPARFTVHEFGVDEVLGVWRDADDVEYVRRYRIRGR